MEIPVRDSARVIKRRMLKAIQKSYVKALTEPTTNSDDSYRRLEENNGSKDAKTITFYVQPKAKSFEIVDLAEGMSKDEMIETFKMYGDEKASHFRKGRGLFGQGLSDVLFTREYGGYVHSIKDGQYCFAQFKWKKIHENGRVDEIRVIKIPDSKIKADEKIRQKYRIPRGNGTNVMFRFTESQFPSKEELIEKLSNYYALRFLNSDPKREVKVVFLGDDGNMESEERLWYFFPQPIPGKTWTYSDTMRFEKYPPIKIEAEISLAENPLSQIEAGEDRQGGLLVYDEHYHVLDLTLFGYDDNPAAARIFGRLKLHGVYDIIRNKLKSHDEMLTETRDGFVRQHAFFQHLKKIVVPWLRPIIDEERQALESQGAIRSESWQKHQQALALLNELFQKVNTYTEDLGTDPGVTQRRPENGIEFDRKTSAIEVNKEYSVNLRIDTRVVLPESLIKINSDNPAIQFRPSQFSVVNASDSEEIMTKSIVIIGTKIGETGKITASADAKSAQITVTVLEEKSLFKPANGLEFNPDRAKAKPGAHKMLNLYVDTEKIPIPATILLSSTDDKIVLDETEVQVLQEHAREKIAKTQIGFRGSGDGTRGKIIATAGDYSAEAHVQIRSVEPPEFAGLFKDWEYVSLPTVLQAYFDRDSGLIRVNANHPVNREYFGSTVGEARESVEKYPHCQILLADLILNECLMYTYSEAYRNNKVPHREPEAPWNDIHRYVHEEKHRIGQDFLSFFVNKTAIDKTKSMLEEFGDIVKQVG